MLDYYDKSHRDLPWRRTRDPYRIWVSEIMLQQTQVDTVIPYYERWLAAFPTVHALARAPLGRVLKLWEGLGYYSRARNLHAAAKQVVRSHGGRLPDGRDELLALPGIGRYTAGAILSIAFDRPEPLVDGNVERVFARLLAHSENSRAPDTRNLFWTIASELVPRRRAGIFNQALMELGALVCTPRAPKCAACPLARWCAARRLGTPEAFPVKPPRKATPRREGVAAVIEEAGRVLVVQRPAEGLLGGLWEVPWVYRKAGETRPAAARRAARERAGVDVRPAAEIPRVEHTFSHFHLTLAGLRATRLNDIARPSYRWYSRCRRSGLAVHASMRRMLDGLEAGTLSNKAETRGREKHR